MTASYDTHFLASDWDGAGLDLQYTVVVRDELPLVPEIATLLPHLLEGIALERWEAVREDDRNESGRDLDALLRFLEGSAASNVTLWVSETGFPGEHFYIEVVAPNQVSVGAPSEFFYTGSIPRDLARINLVVRRADVVVRCLGAFAGVFAVAEEAERLAERAAGEWRFVAPWTDIERQAVAADVLKIVTQFRGA